ncbi:hypothetical protein [Providencia manganoxydans]|uniref:hypothetical protein n=1 Tax=Providencia manganoxydans TaxID=2923283 RepID=UPI0032DB7F32
MKIYYSQSFLVKIKSLTNTEQKLIGDFVTSLQKNGFTGLPGRNKASTGVSKNHANRIKLIQFAIANCLYHYHIGYKSYDTSKKFGDWTSEYVVHYTNKDNDSIKLVAYGAHPPFKLPKNADLV